jgi:undecaprenyl diphosphate synthase
LQGHSKGADRLVELLETLQADGITYCTLFGFSTENWNRPSQEIQDIFRIMEQTARNLVPRLLMPDVSQSIQLRILGDLQDERIPFGLRTILQDLQTMTRKQSNDPKATSKTTLTVCLAVNYGGRQDLVQATRKIAQEVAAGRLSPDAITQDVLESYLTTTGIPDPDLIVRSSGEHRLSNFLLWNAAYAELYVTDTLWPDFDAASWKQALQWYQQRHRRFGSRSPSPSAVPVGVTASSSSSASVRSCSEESHKHHGNK